MKLVGIQAEALGGSFHEEAARVYYGQSLQGVELVPVATHDELLNRFQTNAEFDDSPHNATKFWVVHPLQKGHEQEGTHTAITFEVPDEAGGLRTTTNILRKNGVNITDIDSHLAPKDTHHRAFFAELEQHDGVVKRALNQMRLKGLAPVILGSYTPISTLEVIPTRSKQLATPLHDNWPGQKGLKRPHKAETLYVLTDHRIGSLDRVLNHLKTVNLINMARRNAPEDTDFNRGFYFVLDPKTRKFDTRCALRGIEREGYHIELIPPIRAPKKVKVP